MKRGFSPGSAFRTSFENPSQNRGPDEEGIFTQASPNESTQLGASQNRGPDEEGIFTNSLASPVTKCKMSE